MKRWILALLLLAVWTANAYALVDITNKVQVIRSVSSYNYTTGQTYLSLAVKNTSTEEIILPIRVGITSISSQDVSLANPDFLNTSGKPFLSLSRGSEIRLKPGETTDSKQLFFQNSKRLRFTYSIVVEGLTRLIEIPRKSQTISASDGGTLTIETTESLYSAGLKIEVPPGALLQDTTFGVSDIVSNIPSPPTGAITTGLPVHLLPEGLTFQKPVTVHLPYTDEELISAGVVDPANVKIAYYSPATKSWVVVPLKQIDTKNKTIIFETTHFSIWNKLWPFGNHQAEVDIFSYDNLRNYAQNTWKVYGTASSIEKVLSDSELPYAGIIGGFMAWESMMNSIGSDDHAKAAATGAKYLAKKFLSVAGYSTLSYLVGYGTLAEELLFSFAEKMDKEAFNAQVSFYVAWRNQGVSREEIVEQQDFVYVDDRGWLLNPSGGPSWNPNQAGKLQPSDVYQAGEYEYQMLRAKERFEAENLQAKADFQNALDNLLTRNNPVSSFEIATSSTGNPPLQVSLDPSSSTANNGATIVEYKWTFGDNSPDITNLSPSTVSHLFASPGNYHVKLSVKDNFGLTNTSSKTVVVTTDNLLNQAPVPSFFYQQEISNLKNVIFNASFSADQDGSIVYYEWSLGDGQLSIGQAVSHTYSSYGQYNVTLTVTDNRLTKRSMQKIVDVSSTPAIPVPSSTTSPAANITYNQAQLNASISPNGNSTSAWFEWGTSSTFDTYTSTQLLPVGADNSSHDVSATINSLTPGTTYYYRVAASNGGGESRGVISNFSTAATPSQQPGTWVKYADMPTALLNGAVSVSGGKIYTFGSWNTNTVLEYTPYTNSWQSRAPMLEARGGTVALELGGKIYLSGGNPIPNGSAGLHVYDTVSNTWESKASFPNYLWGGWGVAGGIVNGKMFVIGGYNWPNHDENYCRQYDMVTNTWSLKLGMPIAASWMHATTYMNKIYVVGGNYGTGAYTYINKVQTYDPTTDSWDTSITLPNYLNGAGVVAYGNKIYISGGIIAQPPFPTATTTPNSKVYVLDPWTKQVTTETTMPAVGGGKSVLIGNVLYLVGVGPSGREVWGYGLNGTSVTTTVPGYSNPWLSGMPSGSASSNGDVAPTQSPVQVTGLTFSPRDILAFSAAGTVSNCQSGCPITTPEGGQILMHDAGSENGLSGLTAPLNSLVGIFLGPEQPNLSIAPAALNYSALSTRDATIITPALKQTFFIGDGQTSGGQVQKFVVPAGATRLYLGTMDGWGWFNNVGNYQVSVTRTN